MAQPNPSQNKYNPNSGGSQDEIINEMLDNGFSTEEIMQFLSGVANQGSDPTAAATDSGAGNLDFLTEQLAGDKEQQDMENLLQLIDLLGSEDQSPPETPRLDLPQGNNMEMPDGSSELALSSATARNNMALMNDDIMRQRNRKDATWALQNQPAAAQRAPVDIMQRVAEAKSLYDMLRGKAAPEAAPAGLATHAPPLPQTGAPAPGGGFTPDAGGWSVANEPTATTGTINYLEELRKKAMAGAGSGGSGGVGDPLDYLRRMFNPLGAH